MPRNGSGTFAAPSNSWNPPVDTTTIDGEDWQETLDDIEAGISDSLAKDGQTATTAVIPFSQGIRVSPGSAAAPSMAFIADANTGAYRIAEDIFGIAVGGAERARIESALAKLSLPTLLIDYGSADLSLVNSGSAAAALAHERATAGDVRVDVDPKPSDGSGDSEVALFRGVTTVGTRRLAVYKGNGSATTAAAMTVNASANGLDLDGVFKFAGTIAQPTLLGATRLWRGANGHPLWLSSAAPSSADAGLPLGAIARALASTGYINLGGLILQWGTGTTDSSGEAAVTFPLTFPNALVYSDGQRAATSANVGCTQTSPTTTGVTFRFFDTTSGAAISAGLGIRWFSLGY